MAVPRLSPSSTTSAVRLPITGTSTHVASVVPFGIYTSSADFLAGASDQVAYTYKKLGGDVLDIELSASNVYAAYEEAVLEYSYIVNIHQGKNILGSVLGNSTGSFDHNGQLRNEGNTLSSSLTEGSNVDGEYVHARAGISLKLPRFRFAYSKRIAKGIGSEIGIGGDKNEYSASFTTDVDKQDYDLQSIIYSASVDSDNTGFPFYNKVGKNKINITQVYYKTPQAMWRFYGYYGGLNTVGNLQNYGQWADDSQFQIIPVWQNKLQAKSFESAIYTRNSHYSYEIKNGRIRVYPHTTSVAPSKMWVRFTVDEDAWDETDDRAVGVDGINNLNTIPFANIPYSSINSIGKQWIRRFALALTKEMLGQIRGKFATIPIPGESVTLNGDALISQAKDEQEKLREELKTTLDELVYSKLAENDANMLESVTKTEQKVPMGIFIG
jgi:hypothetical protein